MKNISIFAILLLACFSSCKKDNVEAVPVTQPADPGPMNACPLTIGSYWIYENTDIDTNNVETVNLSNPTDSCYISGDSLYGGRTYFVLVGSILSPTAVTLLRDSTGFIVDPNHNIYYSGTDFTNTLSSSSVPGYVDQHYKMVVPSSSISVPAGTFKCYDYEGIAVFTAGYPWDNPRYVHHYYGNGVGLVRETIFFASSPNYISRRLLHYHIQ